MSTTSGESSAKARPDFSASEIRAGLLVVVSAAALLVLLFLTGNVRFFQETREVRILFDYISGLEKDAPVHFAGHEVGKVTDIQLLPGEEANLVVTASVSKDAALKQDSRATIDTLGLMGEKFVELTPGSPEAPPLEEGGQIRGIDPIAMSAMIKQMMQLVEEVNGAVRDNRDELAGIFKNLEATSQNLKEMSADLKANPWKLFWKRKEKKPDAEGERG